MGKLDLTAADVPKAIERLEHGFAFVGLQEEWESWRAEIEIDCRGLFLLKGHIHQVDCMKAEGLVAKTMFKEMGIAG